MPYEEMQHAGLHRAITLLVCVCCRAFTLLCFMFNTLPGYDVLVALLPPTSRLLFLLHLELESTSLCLDFLPVVVADVVYVPMVS